MIKPSTIIEKANQYLNAEDNRDKYNSFLFKFSECEIYCRHVLNEYLASDGLRPEDIGLEARTVKTAFSEKGAMLISEIRSNQIVSF